MRQANRLIVNTLVTYLRMGVTVGLGLVTLRLLLKTLGEQDFGIFSVLAGGLGFLTIISEALASSAQRHMAYEIGRKDERSLRVVFCTSALIYLVLGVVVAAAGLALRPVLLYGLTIPDARQVAAAWVYDLALLTVSASVLATPFRAVFQARQAMIQDALFDVFASIAMLAAVVFVPYVNADALIGYAVLITIARLSIMAAQILRGLLLFPESRFNWRLVDYRRVRELTSFAGWSFLAALSWKLRTEGSNIILNIFFGPVVNASYGLASQTAAYMTTFANTIRRAAQPAMTALGGAGSRHQMRQLALSTSKLTVLASSFVGMPVILDAQNVLRLWLGGVPPYADAFIPLVMTWVMINQLVTGQSLAMMAYGDIGRIVLYVFCITISPLLLSILMFYLTEASPPWISVLAIASTIAAVTFSAWYSARIIGLPMRQWFDEVVCCAIWPIAAGTAMATVPLLLLPSSVWRPLVVAAVYGSVAAAMIWYRALNDAEKHRFIHFGGAAVNAVRQKIAPAAK